MVVRSQQGRRKKGRRGGCDASATAVDRRANLLALCCTTHSACRFSVSVSAAELRRALCRHQGSERVREKVRKLRSESEDQPAVGTRSHHQRADDRRMEKEYRRAKCGRRAEAAHSTERNGATCGRRCGSEARQVSRVASGGSMVVTREPDSMRYDWPSVIHVQYQHVAAYAAHDGHEDGERNHSHQRFGEQHAVGSPGVVRPAVHAQHAEAEQ
jgi:hypothetical protein